MTSLKQMDRAELQMFYEAALKEYESCKAKGLKLDMSRGKPSRAQVALSNDMLNIDVVSNAVTDGIDAFNYGGLDGLPICRKFFADTLGVKPEQVFVGGNASLQLMYDTIAKAYTHGLLHSEKPWAKLDKVKWLCPAPGYDRHFKVTQSFGMELITVPMNDDGPDMGMVEEVIKDSAVKGMWCVPLYSNPTGAIYSDEVVHRIASMEATSDFRVFWDNAYMVHHLTDEEVTISNILKDTSVHPNRVFEFFSTSKITFPGGGVAGCASSIENIKWLEKTSLLQLKTGDKINQLRHALFLKNKQGVLEHMAKHRTIIKPKFDLIDDMLTNRIGYNDNVKWNNPKGGYFINLEFASGGAKSVYEYCKERGLRITPAGSTFPYGIDPEDKFLRLAPTYLSLDELEVASAILCEAIVNELGLE